MAWGPRTRNPPSAHSSRSASKYQYPHLDPSLRTIRLLRLLGTSTASSIQCELTHCYLDHPKVYDAISYCWGTTQEERERTFSIELDGQRFMVSCVVLDILIRLHVRNQDQLIWIDLVCIDQDSVKDRELQVSRMAEIFRNAREVIVSLGLHSGLAVRRSGPNNCGLQRWNFGSEILRHPWFQRVWVVQEMAFATNILVVLGEMEISGTRFVAMLRKSTGRSERSLLCATAEQLESNQALLDMIAGMKSLRPQLPLAHCLQTFRSFQATLPADKVYALLELCEQSWRIDVDYSVPYERIFMNAVSKILERSSSLSILCCREPRRDEELGSPLLSWVPDWTKLYETPGNISQLRERGSTSAKFPRAHDHSIHTITKKLLSASFFAGKEQSVVRPHMILGSKLVRNHGQLTVYGDPIASITSVFNDGSIEVKLVTGLRSPSRHKFVRMQPLNHPVSFSNALSLYLRDIHKRLVDACGQDLQSADHVCRLCGSTGLAVLRRGSRGIHLVTIDHSQYATYGTVWDGLEERTIAADLNAHYVGLFRATRRLRT